MLPPLLTTGTAFSSTEGGDPAGTTESSSQVEDLDILIGPALLLGPNLLSITADVVESNTQCQCSLSAPTCTGDSDLVGLTVAVLGVPLINLPLDFPPNFQLVNLNLPGVLTLVVTVNEQDTTSVGSYEAITVNALHVELGVIASLLIDTDIKVAHSHSDIACFVAPSAASATLSGRVMAPNGRAISRANVSVMGVDGTTKSTLTNTLGYYSIEDLSAGEFYVVSASARGYTFSPRTVSLGDSVSGFDLYPDARVTAKAAPAPVRSEPVTKQVEKVTPIQRSPQRVVYISGSVFESELPSKDELKILQ